MDGPQTEARERAQAAYRRFLQAAERYPDLLSAIASVLTPDCRIHVQNGDVVGPEESERHSMFAVTAFPDLAITIEDVFFPAGRFVLQVQAEGSAGPNVPFLPPGYRFVAHGCAVGTGDATGLIDELWMYVNPGFAFSFPGSGVRVDPPPPDGAGHEEATTLYREWMRRAEADGDLVRAITSTMAADGVVHLGNGDVGGAYLLDDLFARILDGMPDLTIGIEDVLLEDSRVVVQFTMTGTHLGPIGQWSPSGRPLPSIGAIIARADRNAEAAELWVYVAPAYSVTLPPQSSGASGSSDAQPS
ncbi:MAG: nuclear transport factor 2 family protein [Dehalococcoidia bacterium]